MKRPEGFDQRGSRKPGSPSQQRGDGGQKRRARDTAQPSPSSSRETAPREAPVRAARSPARPEKQAAASRRLLRRAARERRKFERQEVRRFTRRSRRRRLAWAAVVAVVAAMGAVLAVAVFSPLLALRTVEVTGTERLSADEVADAVSGQLETPLALLDLDRIKRELGQFTLIRSYVTETVPPHTLVVHIVERQPIALVANGNSYDQVDPAGVVIASSDTRDGLPLVETGSQSLEDGSFRAAVDVLLAMPLEVLGQVDSISANTPNDVHVRLLGISPVVVWGGPGESALKASVLGRLLDRPECTAAAVIDVSAPLAPICGPQ